MGDLLKDNIKIVVKELDCKNKSEWNCLRMVSNVRFYISDVDPPG